jgi:flagellar hook-associated protein 1 FlgK
VQTVVRATNMFLTDQAAAAKANASAHEARLGLLSQLEKVFGTGAAGLGYSATAMFNAFSELAAAPGDMSVRQAVLARAEDFASLARSNSDQIESLQLNVFTDIRNSVSAVNEMAASVAELNTRITSALSTGHTPNDLMDSRDQLINQISEKIEVQTIRSNDGSISVFVAGGQSLVLGGQANKLVAQQDDYDPSRAALGISVSGAVTRLSTDALGAGSIAGLMAFQNNDLVDARNRLGQIVASMTSAVNQQQSFGIDLAGSTGSPIFGAGTPVAMPHAGNARTAGGAPIGSVALSITDASQLKASEYKLQEDPANAGQFMITRLSDGQTFSGLNDGDVVDGFSFTLGAPPPQPGDHYLLKPVSTAAMGARTVMTNPKGIAAASPVMGAVTPTNTGTGGIASLQVVATPTSTPYDTMTVAFTSATGDYELRDSSNAVVATGTWTAGTPISFNGIALELSGVPANGDSFTVSPTTNPNASNGNALSFDAMAARKLVDGQTFSDAYAETLSSVGVRVQGAAAAAETSAAVAQRAEEALTSEVGVNLDEEAARLIQFQQYYQAAAKLLSTAQTMMDQLLQLGSR